MANITLSVTETALNVSTTLNNITVTDSDGGQTFNVATTLSNINVSAPVTNVIVSESAGVSNAEIRTAISAVDAGGDGSFAYDVNTGIFTYTGPDQTEANARIAAAPTQVRSHFSATAPINLNNGVISIDANALFSGKTTDDLAEGTTNLYFTAARARGNVSATTASGIAYDSGTGVFSLSAIPNSSLTNSAITINGTAVSLGGTRTLTTTDIGEGTNLYFTAARARGNVSAVDAGGLGSFTYSSATGAFTYTGPSDSDVRSLVSATTASGITYDNSTGVFSLANIPNSSLTNSAITINGTSVALGGTRTLTTTDIAEGTNLYFTSDRANSNVVSYIATVALTVGSNLTVNGNINATGNINVQNVEDLYVRDQTIVLNANAASPANVQIVSNRPGLANTEIKWNEQTDRWTFTNDGTVYYNLATSTTDVPEGANLYFTNARANAAFVDSLDNISTAIVSSANITTSANISADVFKSNSIELLQDDVGDRGILFNMPRISGGDTPVFYFTNAATGTGNVSNWKYILQTGSFTGGSGNGVTPDLTWSANGNNATGANYKFNDFKLRIEGANAANNTLYVQGNITTAQKFVGDGSALTGITTTQVSEGANLYFTTDRANTNSNAWLTTKSTTDLVEGANLYFTNARANAAFVDSLDNISTAIVSSANISTTGNLSVGNIVNVTNIEGTGPFATITMNSINPKEIILGQDFGSKIFFPYNGASGAAVGQYLRVDSVNGSGSTLAVKNFGLSFQNIGTFGNVSAGDPANISYSQTSSVVRAGLSGDVGDITVSGVAQGDTGWIVVYQHAGSGRQLTLGSAWKMEGCTTGNPVNIAQAQDEETLIFWTYDGTYYRGTVHPNIGSNVSVDIKTTGNIVGGNANITNAVNATTVNATNVNGTTVTATTANATTVNGTTVNATTLVATTANANTVNANTIATSAASNTVNINANVTSAGNIVANASVITVTNGSNFIPNAERNLGLTIDRNNNTANASASVVTGSSIAYRGGFSPDRIVFSGVVDGYFDGQPVTISGFTDPTLAGALNGNVFYLRMRPALPGTYDIYSNPTLTTAVNLAVGNLTGTTAGPGTITFTRRNSVTPKEWAVNLDQVSNDLRIKEDGTTRVTVASGGNVDITGTANANAIIVNQPGTAGTYANTALVDASPGILTGGSFGDVSNVSNVFVSIFDSGQLFPVGSAFQMTFTGVTGPGNININGQTFYSNGFDAFGDASAVQLFTDAAATTPANAVVIGILPGNGTGSGNVSFSFTAGSTGNNWQLSSVNGNLDFAHNGTVKGNINSAGNLTITGRHTYDRVYGEFYHSANITPAAADTIYSFPLDTTVVNSDVLVNNTSRINIVKPGTFKIFASIQVKNNNNAADHIMRFWMRKNGVDVAGSATVITPLKLQEQVVSMHWMVDSDGDDYFEIVYYVNSTQVVFPNYDAITSPVTAPQAPPIIVNVLPVGA